MLIELGRLLSEREIIHPCRIVSATLERAEFCLSIEGYPWWQSNRSLIDGKIAFHFHGVGDGIMNLAYLCGVDSDDHALEEFGIWPTSKLDWAQPNEFSIYCSAPLPRPLAVYTAVQDYLLSKRANRCPGDFLNSAERIGQFVSIAASSGYHLATAPGSICKIIQQELDSQSVPYTVLNTKDRAPAAFYVRLDGQGFFCENAVAEFE